MEQSITFKNVDCTIEGGQFDFGAAGVEGAEQTVAKAAVEMLLMSFWSQAGFVVYFAFERSSTEVKRIRGREANLDNATVILQAIESVGKKLAGEQDVTGGGLRVDMKAVNVGETEISADGRNLKFSSTTSALKRAAHSLNGYVAGGVFEINSGSHGFHVHIA